MPWGQKALRTELRLAGNASRVHVEPGEEENETEVENESNENESVWRLCLSFEAQRLPVGGYKLLRCRAFY